MSTFPSLLEGQFRIELIDRRGDFDINYHSAISKDVSSIADIHPSFAGIAELFHSVNLPIALKLANDKQYHMIARYWVLQYVIDKGIQLFPAIIFDDPGLVPEVLELVKLENDYFTRKAASTQVNKIILSNPRKKQKRHIKKQPASSSRATNGRHEAKYSGRLCPFCPGTLRKATGKYNTPQGDLLASDGPNRIHCSYRRNKYKCTFRASVTKLEIDLFRDKSKDFPTTSWLVLVPGKKCPDCNDDVYARTIRRDNGKVEVWERCRKHFDSGPQVCTWQKRIK